MKLAVTAVDLARAAWRKSSFSTSGDSNCVEIATVPAWRKSSFSGDGNSNCVEVAGTGRAIAVRDSKNPGGPALVVGPQAWRRFAACVKGGHLDV